MPSISNNAPTVPQRRNLLSCLRSVASSGSAVVADARRNGADPRPGLLGTLPVTADRPVITAAV